MKIKQVQEWDPRVRSLVGRLAAARRWNHPELARQLERELAQIKAERLRAVAEAAAREAARLREEAVAT